MKVATQQWSYAHKELHMVDPEIQTVDVAVVGAGFTGLYMVHQMRERGFSVVGLERGSGVGGTWYWNRYPGLRCDVESMDYSYSFNEEIQQEWVWTEKFPAQPDILRYLEFVAQKLDLNPIFRFDTEVTSAVWDEPSATWHVQCSQGPAVHARFVVWGTGILSTPKIPDIPGLDSFQGELLITSQWPKTPVSYEGKRVAVMGTGSTGIQVIPIAAETAEHVFALQRTPSYSLPAHNKPLDPARVAEIKANYGKYRKDARATFLGCVVDSTDKSFAELGGEGARAALQKMYDYGSPMRFASTLTDIPVDLESNAFTANFVREKIRERVGDDALAVKLTPEYHILTRRLCIDTNYYETYRRENVTLVDMREEPVVRVTPTGFETTAGSYDVDMIVLATGFDAITGTLTRLDIRGRHGISLAEKWGHAPSCYLGLSVAGFPNMFMATGPASPAPQSNVVVTIEIQVEWMSQMLSTLREQGVRSFEPTEAAEQAWVDNANAITDSTLMRFSDSWYVGTNVAGKPRVQMVYLGGVPAYESALLDVAAENYAGFTLTQ